MSTFPCGHPIRNTNLVLAGSGKFRCKTCKNRKTRERRAQERDVEFGGFENNMEYASYNLLRAIHRSHPYVFDAAERSGRMAVRP